jgi:hypothetical protein
MKWLLASFIVFTHALVPYCINCKHFINGKSGLQYGKCRVFPIEPDDFLVTGKHTEVDYKFCSTARNNEKLCGNSGKYFKHV